MRTGSSDEGRLTDLRDAGSDGRAASRRSFLLAALSVGAAGCANSAKTVLNMPAPAWPAASLPRLEPELPPTEPEPSVVASLPAGVVRRAAWATERPAPMLMNRMLPVRHITVHHDALMFTADDRGSTAARIEAIRRYHRHDRGWGDIGYHYVVDRAGRVWEGRPLNYQGAHVKDHNEGNIGVVALGNFDEQYPTDAQVHAVVRHVAALMQRFRVSLTRVRTHQEWAVTACPGVNMQRRFVTLRSNGLRA